MKNKNPVSIAIAIFVLILVSAGAYYYWQNSTKATSAESEAANTPSLPSPAAADEDSVVHYPVPTPASTEASQKPLPRLDESDLTMSEELAQLYDKTKLENLINSEDLVRHIVVTIENAKEKQLPARFSPFKAVDGSFETLSEGDHFTINPSNYKRYAPFVDLAKNVDLKKVSQFYFHFYSLFQSAYNDLGHKGYFNDRVISAIDSILKTPDIKEPLLLEQPSVYYKFLDKDLESLNASQKILLRVGPENAQILKQKLKELRGLLSSAKD